MQKKVLFVISSLGGGGAERVLVNVANQMICDGIEVTILKTSARITKNYGIGPKIRVVELPRYDCCMVKKVLKLIFAMRKVFKQHPDSTIISFLSDNNMLSIIAAAGLKNKVVISERNDPSKNCINAAFRQLRNFLYRFSDWNVFQTEDARNYFSAKIRRKSSIIPNPIIIPESVGVHNANKIIDNTILAVGRLTKQKNYPMMLKAFKIFHELKPEYILDIYGEGELKAEILGLISELSLDKCVNLCGFSTTVYEKMKNSIMYISSSDYEGISNTMLEALALGVPTIVTDCPIGGARMVIDDGVNGYLVPVGNAKTLAQKMLVLAESTEVRTRFSINSIKIRQNYSISRICKMWEEIL